MTSTPRKPRIALMVARARNGCIGRNNTLPWHLPNDLKHFKAVTMGKPVIMGRNTWDSLGRPLPGRDNIVITRQPGFSAAGATVVNSLTDALALAQQFAQDKSVDEVVVIGGAQIYAEALPNVQRAYITEVDADIEGDTFFPALASEDWRETARDHHAACEKNPYPYSFVTLERRSTDRP